MNWVCEAFRCIGVENAKIWYSNSNYKIHRDTRFLMYRYFFNPFFDLVWDRNTIGITLFLNLFLIEI